MSYYFSTIVDLPFEEALEKVEQELKKEGFGILTEIDVKATLKKKLDVDFNNYKILGACNPPFAYKALQAENKIGAMLPCNFVVQEHEGKKVEVSGVDPVSSMQAIVNPQLEGIAAEVRQKIKNVINNL